MRCNWVLALTAGLVFGLAQAAGPGEAQADHPGPDEGVRLITHSAAGVVPVRSWKRLRDDRVVKQDLDYSCGAASLATLLNEYYGQSLTEERLLKAMDKGDGRASFADMARALAQFGFKAQGFAASYAQLTQLKLPVIVYVKHRKDDHFAVLRGIDGDTVWLADPSLGNRTYSRAQFEAMWNTRDDALAGKFLVCWHKLFETRARITCDMTELHTTRARLMYCEHDMHRIAARPQPPTHRPSCSDHAPAAKTTHR